MILSNVAIQAALDDGRLVIEPQPSPRTPTPGQPDCPFQTSAVDLRLADEISVYKGTRAPVAIDLTKGKFKDLASVMEPRRLTAELTGAGADPRPFLTRTSLAATAAGALPCPAWNQPRRRSAASPS